MVFKVKVTKLQGYELYWIFSILEWKGYKVTKVTEDTHMFFSKIKLFLWGYEVTRLRRLQGYEIAKSSTYLATTASPSCNPQNSLFLMVIGNMPDSRVLDIIPEYSWSLTQGWQVLRLCSFLFNVYQKSYKKCCLVSSIHFWVLRSCNLNGF